MQLVPATPTENIPGLGGQDHCEKFASQDEKRPYQLNELVNVPIRIQRDIPQEVIPPLARAEREDERTVHVPELKSLVPKNIENYRAILGISEG